MSATATAPLDLDTAWQNSQALIHSMIRKTLTRYGGDYDDMLSEAHLAFVEAWRGFNSLQDTKFSTWLYHKLRGRLLEHIRVRSRRWKRTESDVPYGSGEGEAEVAMSLVPLADVVDELSEDGRLLVQLIIETPIALQIETNPRRMLKSLSEFMADNYNWSCFRSAITFSEIADALH